MEEYLSILQERTEGRGLLNIVFVHGWHHGAGYRFGKEDENIQDFRKFLGRVARVEELHAEDRRSTPRLVAGLYVGWRGDSVALPVLNELTFWDRKTTAHKVGNGGVMRVLSELESLRDKLNQISDLSTDISGSRLNIIGHSFGAAIVFSSINEVLQSRFVSGTSVSGEDAVIVDGFGDLTILVNPAFEASQFGPLSDMSVEYSSYGRNQPPILAILSSESDQATRTAFSVGRFASTVFESTRIMTRQNMVTGRQEEVSQYDSNIRAVGHFKPYRTHNLNVFGERTLEPGSISFANTLTLNALFVDQWQSSNDQTIYMAGSILERLETSPRRNPYLNIFVDEGIIDGHNDIFNPRIEAFIRQLMFSDFSDTNRD